MTNSNKYKGADVMKIMFEIISNVSLAIVVSAILISMMSLVKRICNKYLYRKVIAD